MNEPTLHQDGAPWTSVGRFDNFEQADQKRLELLLEESVQVKVKRCGPEGTLFQVKTRLDPDSVAAELRREEKRRRKKKLSKKRRKK